MRTSAGRPVTRVPFINRGTWRESNEEGESLGDFMIFYCSPSYQGALRRCRFMGEIRHEYRGRIGVLWSEIYLSARVTVTSCIFIGKDKSQYFENSSKLSARPCKSEGEGRETKKGERERENVSHGALKSRARIPLPIWTRAFRADSRSNRNNGMRAARKRRIISARRCDISKKPLYRVIKDPDILGLAC